MSRSLPLDYDIVVYAATSYRRTFRWLPDGVNPVDFTGWYAQMRIGQPLYVADVELDSVSGDIVLTGDGYITVNMTPQVTAALQGTVTWYNLDLTQPDGFVRRFLRGRVSLIVDVKQQ